MSTWVAQIVDRCFASDRICSAEVKLIEPLLRVLFEADAQLAHYVSQALADLSLLAATILKTAEFAGLSVSTLHYEDPKRLAADVAAEYKRNQDLLRLALLKFRDPNVISANLLIPSVFFDLGMPEPAEVKQHMLAAKADRQHAIAVCSLLGGGSGVANLVQSIRVECSAEADLWIGGSAATALTVWGSDERNFDDWGRSGIARLWEEAASSVSALIPLDALPHLRQVRAIESLLEWGLAGPENPLDLAVRLLKGRFAPELTVISWTDSYGQNVREFVLGPQRRLPIIAGPLDPGEVSSLLAISRCSMLYRQRTNLWRLFGLPDTADALEAFARQHATNVSL